MLQTETKLHVKVSRVFARSSVVMQTHAKLSMFCRVNTTSSGIKALVQKGKKAVVQKGKTIIKRLQGRRA